MIPGINNNDLSELMFLSRNRYLGDAEPHVWPNSALQTLTPEDVTVYIQNGRGREREELLDLLNKGFLEQFQHDEDTPQQEIRMKIKQGKRNLEAMEEVSRPFD